MDLAYNDLFEFDFASFDQVGTLSSFKVNASHNEIHRLSVNSSFTTSMSSSEYFFVSLLILHVFYKDTSILKLACSDM